MEEMISVSDFINEKNASLSGTTYYDERLNRFKNEVQKYGEKEKYSVLFLKRIWEETESGFVYNDRGINTI